LMVQPRQCGAPAGHHPRAPVSALSARRSRRADAAPAWQGAGRIPERAQPCRAAALVDRACGGLGAGQGRPVMRACEAGVADPHADQVLREQPHGAGERLIGREGAAGPRGRPRAARRPGAPARGVERGGGPLRRQVAEGPHLRRPSGRRA
jgi:hypothetical protein